MISHRLEKRFNHEILVALSARDHRGESKHALKLAARKAAQDSHSKYHQPPGIFSTTTINEYRKNAMMAFTWITSQHGCRHISDCRPYLAEYYADMLHRNLSAWTIHLRVYALCAVFDEPYQNLFGVEKLPARHRADITRTRTTSQTSARFTAQHHRDARTLARACGARRGGLMRLTGDDLRVDDAGNMRIHLLEKGGKERDALVLPAYHAAVRDIFQRYGVGKGAVTGGKRRLFPLSALPKDMALHSFRAAYAQDLYRYFEDNGAATGSFYHCRLDKKGLKYDKGVLMAVSKNLGHSRCDVVVSHYLL